MLQPPARLDSRSAETSMLLRARLAPAASAWASAGGLGGCSEAPDPGLSVPSASPSKETLFSVATFSHGTRSRGTKAPRHSQGAPGSQERRSRGESDSLVATQMAPAAPFSDWTSRGSEAPSDLSTWYPPSVDRITFVPSRRGCPCGSDKNSQLGGCPCLGLFALRADRAGTTEGGAEDPGRASLDPTRNGATETRPQDTLEAEVSFRV